MRRSVRTVGILVLIGLVGLAPATWAGPGDVETVHSFDPDAGELPEGITIDKRGRIFVSMTFTGELRRIDSDGSEHTVATLPTGGGFGPAGLAVDAPGNVYVGVPTFDPATQGVWKVDLSGGTTRLPGTEAIAFPNGVAFGDGGTLYVTDSIAGAVWRIAKGGSAELFAQHPLLEGDGSSGLGFPIGANGIAYRNGMLFVTNSELGRIVTVEVGSDGTAGATSELIRDPALNGADGLALDVHGDLYVAVILQSTIVRVPRDGSGITLLADGDDGLDTASSVEFGTGMAQRKTLFAVNFSIGPVFGGERTHGPGIVALNVGVPGLPQP